MTAIPPKPEQLLLNQILANALTTRTALLQQLLDPKGRDLDKECGYPRDITPEHYKALYDREGIAARVVQIYPEESWQTDPEVYETEDETETPFEKAWKDNAERHNFYHYLQNVDELSGIGHFGVLLIGIDDGKDLKEPVAGYKEPSYVAVDEAAPVEGTPAVEPAAVTRKILYLRCFDESLVQINKYDTDITSPRYGLPVEYTLTFAETKASGSGAAVDLTSRVVHWHRVLHVADNRKSSETFGVPRMRSTYNRLYDLRKILGGSGEMFWLGAFPGYSFEVNPELAGEGVEIDATAMREEFQNYANGLQRYLALTGVTAKSLAPQVADPTQHVHTHLMAIAVTIGVPLRVFMGSEEGKQAADQDGKRWNSRLMKRQKKYLTPLVVRPFGDKLIAMGVLPKPAEWHVFWPDLNAPGDEEKMANLEKVMRAVASYITSGAQTLIPPLEFFTKFVGLDEDEATAILEAAMEEATQITDGSKDRIGSEMSAEDKAAEQAQKDAEIEATKAGAMAKAGGFPK
jgi:hypothetical protein